MTCGRIFCPVCGARRFVSFRIADKSAPVCFECGLASRRAEWKDDPEQPGTVAAWAEQAPVSEEAYQCL